MSRKSIIYLTLVILVLVGAGALYFLILKDQIKKHPPAVKAIPNSALVAFKGNQFPNLYKQFSKTAIGQDFNQQQKVGAFKKRMLFLDSLVRELEPLNKKIAINDLWTSLHNTSVDQLNLAFYLQLNTNESHTFVKAQIKKLGGSYNYQERRLKDYKIVDVLDQEGQTQFTFTCVDGILVVSKNPLLVEDAIRTYNAEKAPRLTKAILDAQQHSDAFFVNFEQLPDFLGTFLSSEARTSLEPMANFANVAQLTPSFKSDILNLHGILNSNESKNHYLDFFRTQTPVKSKIPNILPLRTAQFISFSLKEPKAYYEQMVQQLKSSNEFRSFKQKEDSLELEQGYSIQKDFLPILGQELGLVVNEPVSSDFRDDIFAAMYCENIQEKVARLDSLNKKIEKGKEGTTAPLPYRDHQIKRVAFSQVFSLLFGKYFDNLQKPFYTVVNNFILFSDNRENLKRVIDDYLAGQTLKASSHYTKLTDQLLSKNLFYSYINPQRALMIPLNFINNSYQAAYREQFDYFKQFNAFTFQVTQNEPGLYMQTALQRATHAVAATELLWKQKLESNLAGKPEVVKNHNNDRNELFLTDQANKAYLMTNSGNILWTKKLPSKINGAIAQIDLYDNGNLQYAFATNNHLQLFDRTGSDVANFPIGLSKPASTELKVFDYLDQKDYRYFIGCKNNTVYGYHGNGKPLEGWSPLKIDAPLSLPMKYFIFQNQTYLFGVSDKGTFYFWDQEGKPLMEPIKLKTKFNNPFQINFGKDLPSTYLVSSDTSGQTYFINLKGEVDTSRYGNWGKNHYFDYLDINSDNKQEFIFSQDNRIKAYHEDSSQVFSLTLSDSLAYRPQFFKMEDRYRIGYVAESTQQIFLIEQDGTFYEGFPLKGTTPFEIADINADGAKELMVGGKDGMVYMYRIP